MLKKYRNEIDKIDEEMKKLFLKRMEIVKNIADYKAKSKIDVLDNSREKEMFAKLTNDIKDEKLKKLYISYLFKIIELSKIYQKELIEND